MILQPRRPFGRSTRGPVSLLRRRLLARHRDLRDRDAVALRLARQRDLVAAVGLQIREVLIGNLIGLAARNEHVLRAAVDALRDAVVVAVGLRPVLGLGVLAVALGIADDAGHGLV